MKRSAFNIIELVFVIIILGILAAVVTSKLGQMGDKAKKVQLQAMTGTLNRSMGSVIWYQSILDDNNGSVKFASYDVMMKDSMSLASDYLAEPSLLNCNVDGNGTYITYIYTKVYEIHCKDGTHTTSPKFRLYNATDSVYID